MTIKRHFLAPIFIFSLAACVLTPVDQPNVESIPRTPALEFRLPITVAKRAQKISQYKDLATGKKWRSREALGAARLETHLQGRKVTPGKNTSVDWVDQKLGDLSFKGPLVDDTNYDGVLEPLEHFDLEAIKRAIQRDLENNTETSILVVDTLGLSDGEVRFLEGEIRQLANPFKKIILLMREKEMKTLIGSKPPGHFSPFAEYSPGF